MQVYSKCVHRANLLRTGTYNWGNQFLKFLVIKHPGTIALKPALYGQVLPVAQLLINVLSGSFWLQAQRVTAEINERPVVLLWKQKLITQFFKGILLIQVLGKFQRVFKNHLLKD
ncbi:hypothetical protein D3C87_1547090 [compost metagenome]